MAWWNIRYCLNLWFVLFLHNILILISLFYHHIASGFDSMKHDTQRPTIFIFIIIFLELFFRFALLLIKIHLLKFLIIQWCRMSIVTKNTIWRKNKWLHSQTLSSNRIFVTFCYPNFAILYFCLLFNNRSSRRECARIIKLCIWYSFCTYLTGLIKEIGIACSKIHFGLNRFSFSLRSSLGSNLLSLIIIWQWGIDHSCLVIFVNLTILTSLRIFLIVIII